MLFNQNQGAQSYDGTLAQQPPQPASLIQDVDHANDRLCEIRNRISRVADMLHGSQPSPVGNNKGNAEMVSRPLRLHLDDTQHLLAGIEQELSRVENNL